MNTIENKKISDLLKSKGLANVELGFQLCLSQQTIYNDKISDLLKKHPIFCIRYGLEKEYIQQLNLLNLANQNISDLPTEVRPDGLPNLQGLLLYDNQFIELPEEIGRFRQLDLLQLENNRLSSLPKSIVQLKELRFLSLAFNRFMYLPFFIYELENLTDLDLTGNLIPQKELDRIQKHLPNCTVHF